jgi:hypothetical protein
MKGYLQAEISRLVLYLNATYNCFQLHKFFLHVFVTNQNCVLHTFTDIYNVECLDASVKGIRDEAQW